MTLLIAIGNTLRRDDGAAHRALELVGDLAPEVTARSVHQLTPELAEEIGRHDRVMIVDADASAGNSDRAPRLERLAPDAAVPRTSLGHALPAAEVVAFARLMFGFRGEAWLCRIPATDFGGGEQLSPEAERNAQSAARLLAEWLLPQRRA